MRVFVALELPSAVIEAAAGIQRELTEPGAAIGWVRAEGMHLTLKFFGEVSPDRLAEIETALAAAAEGTGPVEIKVRGLGVFPNPRNPRVIWAGIRTPDDRLARLQERIDQAVAPLGFPPEKREFRPHLTLGRVKSSRGLDGVMKGMAARHDFDAGECTLDRLHLIQSELKPGGAVYTKLWSVAL